MRKLSISNLVYNVLFPKPRANDPTSFASHITRNLVPEVRVETSTFYGSLDCVEAQYPGLDYSFPPHRMRLSRFHHHKRLFKAFDELGLTKDEIASLCRWEGTKSARDRYERDEGIRVRDTTADGIYVSSPHVPATIHLHPFHDDEGSTHAPSIRTPDSIEIRRTHTSHDDSPVEDESSEDELEESVGFALNQHLLEATAARERGADVSLDDVWEQWLKDAIERGSYEDILHTIREGSVDFARALTSPTTIYGNSLDARQARQRVMQSPNTALASGLSQYGAPDPSPGPPSHP
ncbi:hypothetical protein LOZ53_003116 [Ophidiomyces ophidiicola]|uniref:Uncharacterized protein n=1 Tax=Ophidiomyces ophidiicola TaxID=1387563 RepID=A0ACB8UNS6_9EURO|nr:uncharacterized protein LOZ57_005214 [Ophidiomyces ophidiicola]KAI1912901.1 hypothetical protein LOZ61_003105 [Ophidiomyces ophidiicola]KAI1917554.1 hypothetical protein LOZ64_003034 [Ophidiomyces ophidiicola]KAI1930772.1 hypothetical protein LOZ60_000748 [Ophidiomyces ophidiicola]KAI1942917.1 hypothetical protein LOZ57_005214 [Ophidiomyces ophidiicola]KAI1962217.1 hypothetical protein LOZ59_002047 [Ophidiomyces ophidiicola]